MQTFSIQDISRLLALSSLNSNMFIPRTGDVKIISTSADALAVLSLDFKPPAELRFDNPKSFLSFLKDNTGHKLAITDSHAEVVATYKRARFVFPHEAIVPEPQVEMPEVPEPFAVFAVNATTLSAILKDLRKMSASGSVSIVGDADAKKITFSSAEDSGNSIEIEIEGAVPTESFSLSVAIDRIEPMPGSSLSKFAISKTGSVNVIYIENLETLADEATKERIDDRVFYKAFLAIG